MSEPENDGIGARLRKPQSHRERTLRLAAEAIEDAKALCHEHFPERQNDPAIIAAVIGAVASARFGGCE